MDDERKPVSLTRLHETKSNVFLNKRILGQSSLMQESEEKASSLQLGAQTMSNFSIKPKAQI